MANYNGLGDRLEQAGSPYSAANGASPKDGTGLYAPGTIRINNTFTKGDYLDFVIDAESVIDVSTRGNDADTRNVGTRA